MNYFEFKCPHCKQSIEAPEEMMGNLIDCPTCKKPIEIPHAKQPNQQVSHSIPAPKPTVPADIKTAKPHLPSGVMSLIIGISAGLVFLLIYKDTLIERLPAIGICILLVVYLLPTIIAEIRDHHYKSVIMVINIVMALIGVGYLVAFIFVRFLLSDSVLALMSVGYLVLFIWAVWPSKTSVLDPLIASPVPPPLQTERAVNDYEQQLRVLAKLKEDGVITAQEFDKKKKSLLGV